MEERRALSRIGEGLSSCVEVQELQHLRSLKVLCLHGNNISRIEGLQHLSGLQELNLSSNRITSISNLGGLTALTSLNLASNKLVHLQGLDPLPNLVQLNLSYNALTSLASLSTLAGPHSKLRVLDVRQNQLPSLQAFAVLAGCVSLRELSISGNPACAAPNHRHMLLQALPQIARLDSISSADVLGLPPDVASAHQFASERLQSFDQQVAGLHYQQQQMQPAAALSTGGKTPHMDASLASFHQKQRSGSPLRAFDRGALPGTPSPAHWHQQQQHTAQMPRQGGNWQQHPQGGTGVRRTRGGPEGSGVFDTGAGTRTTGVSGQSTEAHDSRSHRVYVVDAAVQTSERMSAQARLENEAELLRQQLTQLTDELERRNVVEEQVQQDMQAALLAAQEQAHKQVEEGYREASQAVATALRELEAVRLQGQQAQEQVLHHMKLQEEAKAQCAALQSDVSRAQDDVRRARDQASAEQQRAQAALEHERQRAADAQQALQQQLIALEQRLAGRSSDLDAVQQRATSADQRAAAAEQRAAALDAALQQANSATLSMTGQMAQSMADTNLQLETLKGKLASAEKQLADQQRREAEARAEVSMLMSSLTMQKQNHQQELEAKERAASEQLAAALERERGAAEERGKASVLILVQKEKSALQEQLAFLKMQLQYALTESEREVAQVNESLSHSQAEAQELKAALQAAVGKSKEQETLVADLTHVLQQQKAHIQAQQKEKDNLVQQLRACGPERFDQLLAENHALRRANAELDVLREQVLHHKRAWQDAERRILESQATHARSMEELQGKISSLEAALLAAKEEAKAATHRLEAAQQQLTASEDAVKVKRAMLDSANDTIEQLKAELADMQGELEDTRRMAEELEGQLRGGHEQDATEKANLRSEIEAGEAAIERMNASLAEAHSKQREAEAKLKAAHDALAEKEAMLNYVNEEVDRVKGLFEQREGRLREERDHARQQAELALIDRDKAEGKVKDLRHQLEALAKEMETAHAEARASKEAAAAAEAEAAVAARRVAETEDEMRQLLVAVDRQKAMSANKMKQLASMLQEL